MQHIETIELGSSQSSIEFTSIPQDGTDLVVLISARSDHLAIQDNAVVGFNTDVWDSGNFNSVRLVTSSNSPASATASNAQFKINGDSSTSNTFGNVSIYITNYATTDPKSFSTDYITETNSSDIYMGILANSWGLSEAINKVTLSFPDSAEFMSGSTISLYKITAGGDGTVTTS